MFGLRRNPVFVELVNNSLCMEPNALFLLTSASPCAISDARSDARESGLSCKFAQHNVLRCYCLFLAKG